MSSSRKEKRESRQQRQLKKNRIDMGHRNACQCHLYGWVQHYLDVLYGNTSADDTYRVLPDSNRTANRRIERLSGRVSGERDL